jgi:hypothetical protein
VRARFVAKFGFTTQCSAHILDEPGATRKSTHDRELGLISTRQRNVGGITGKYGQNPPHASKKSFESEGGQPEKNAAKLPVFSSSYPCEKWMAKQGGTDTEYG